MKNTVDCKTHDKIDVYIQEKFEISKHGLSKLLQEN